MKVLKKTDKNLKKAFKLLTQMPKDFFIEKRKDLPPQKRETLNHRHKNPTH